MARQSRPKLIVRIKGGLGNQLFCYAAARSIAHANNLELVIDHVTGFIRDHTYRRHFGLGAFSIPCRMATARERMEPFERGRRMVSKVIARRCPFARRAYLEEGALRFEPRLFSLGCRRSRYLDGLWQDERYFTDIDEILRSDLRLNLSPDQENQSLARQISDSQSVAVHIRWFMSPTASNDGQNLGVDYYYKAMKKVESEVNSPHYFVFSDDISFAIKKLKLPPERITPIKNNPGDDGAIVDFWLMSQCRHFVTSNSTFSWWAAWLGRPKGGVITIPSNAPRMQNAVVFGDKNSQDTNEHSE